MDRKRRCPDVAEAIIDHLRNECAVSSTDGLETTVEQLASTIGASPAAVSPHLKRLMDFNIIILRKGIFEKGHTGPKSFSLAEKFEAGEEWKNVYYGENGSSHRKTMAPTPVLASEIIKANTKTAGDKNLLEELVQAYARIKELQERVIEVQNERNTALETVQRQKASIEELEQDLKVEAETAQRSCQDLATLELHLREARSQVAGLDRRIAKNDGRLPVAFATR